MERAEEAQTGDESGVFGEWELQAKDADVATVGEWKADLTDGPGAREGRDFAVAGGEQRGAREWRGGGAEAIEGGGNLLGRGHVRGGDGVIAELGDAEGAGLAAVADGDGVDVTAGVGFFCDGDGGEEAGEAFSVETAFEDL